MRGYKAAAEIGELKAKAAAETGELKAEAVGLKGQIEILDQRRALASEQQKVAESEAETFKKQLAEFKEKVEQNASPKEIQMATTNLDVSLDRLLAANNAASATLDEGWGNVRVADNPAALRLFLERGQDQTRFRALLTENMIACWARRMSGRSYLVRVPAQIWNENAYLHFQPKQEEGNPNVINQTYIRNGREQPMFYDAYLNFARMKRFWPDIELEQAKEEVL
jgi:predicted RNA-binding Zn ribbon-like protein